MKVGTPKFDGLTIGELSANFLQGPGVVNLKAKAAFVNTKNGGTHGWTMHEHWSPTTLAKLKELTELMEEDIAKVHFSDGSYPVLDFRETSPGTPAQATGGLGEHLGTGDEAPQV